jgi:PAS domain S-box-containing protein
MRWLAFGVVYTLLYPIGALMLSDSASGLAVFRLVALLGPPVVSVVVIVRRRHSWTGCQWLFWATIAMGLVTTGVGHIGWTVDELLLQRQTSWLGWHVVFVMFGTAAPLLALLAQPHRGTGESVAATTAVDIAGIAVMTGYLYSYLVTSEDLASTSGHDLSLALVILSELQPFVVFAGMSVAAIAARATPWGSTYRRLAVGLFVSFVTLTLSNIGIWQGAYRPGFVYDFAWILPLAFYPWAASHAPASPPPGDESEQAPRTPSRPWVIFATLALIPIIDYALRRTVPAAALGASRDLSTAVTIVSVLPLLLARLAVERAELRRTDDRLRLLAAAVEQADELILILTEDRQFFHANDAFCRALGYSRAELRTVDPRALLAEASKADIDAAQATLAQTHVWRGGLIRLRKDGTTFPSSCVIVSLVDARDRVTHIVTVERDVTDELRLREQLVHTERLSAAGQLVSGVAHEMNNPLQSVIGYAELLLDGEHRPAPRQDLEKIRAEALRAARIVRNLLSFVRRSPGTRVLVSINQVVQSTVALRVYELETANIEVEEHYSEDLPAVSINREEIQQVVLNLILNAEQAMRTVQGRRRVMIRTADGPMGVSVEVADDGSGVPPELAGRVFEPFFTTKDVGEGTGLGLSIALGIATAHGGDLTLVQSSSGACFRLTLPACTAAAPPPSAQLPADEVSSTHVGALRSVR